LAAHWGHICAADFLDVEVVTLRGLVRYQALVVIDLGTRVATVAGVVRQSHGVWVENTFRELSNPIDGFLRGKTHLIIDRDPVFTADARAVLESAGLTVIRLPRSSPNLNAYAERFIGSIRNHQALGGSPPASRDAANGRGSIQCRERIGGLLRHYHREAA